MDISNRFTCLEPYLSSFEESLSAKNYEPATAETYRYLLRRFGQLLEDEGVAPSGLTTELAVELGRRLPTTPKSQIKVPNIATLFVEHLTEIGVATRPPLTTAQAEHQELLGNLELYLLRQRGLSPRSVKHVLGSATRFLANRFGDDGLDLPALSARDYAMLLLMSRLCMRAPEVMAVQLDDIDWRAVEIMVRGKGQRHDRLPIPPDVGEAISRYLREERTSTTTRTLFVSHRAPNRPFKDSQIINSVLLEAFAATGVKPPTPCVGSHVLRHSLATNLVRSGTSLEEIGDLLRHRSRATTMIYAKLDTDGLRSIAQPWPIADAAQ